MIGVNTKANNANNNVNSGGSINNPHAHAAYKNNSGSNSSAIRSFMKGNLKNQQ